jgi:predicted SprT family Zn-dependent metalloprotease
MIVPTTSAAWPRGTGSANGEKWLGSFKGIAKDLDDSKFEHGRIDIESLKMIQGLDLESWKKASFEQRCSALKELANKIADQTGIPRANVVFEDMRNIRSCGAFYEETNTLAINSQHLKQRDNPRFRSVCIETVAHEMRHAYQYYAVKHPGFHPNSREVEYWAANMPHYITPEMAENTFGFEYYEKQPLEIDASQMGKSISHHLKAPFESFEQMMHDGLAAAPAPDIGLGQRLVNWMSQLATSPIGRLAIKTFPHQI